MYSGGRTPMHGSQTPLYEGKYFMLHLFVFPICVLVLITSLLQLEIVRHIIMVVPHLYTMALELLELGILLSWIHLLASQIWTDSIWTILTIRCRTLTTFLRLREVIMLHRIIHFRRTILLRHLVITVRWIVLASTGFSSTAVIMCILWKF